jgi:hypothetical protein
LGKEKARELQESSRKHQKKRDKEESWRRRNELLKTITKKKKGVASL